ncbi:hypothetical protein K503DRAFT_444376 [Rhizopogon vinicolor AM-OR11-026]|uniref:Uncharacterized protein n=1 Tax=Rhizopogon vinicolor AM-OR11-026 TaxID=1314800 RepID=A0A1B7MP94_9AGAM|nr:hypothetical protein K503DRAFT_444376 [Rhizopogon vinicolor AM-OR11-026]
MGSSKDVRLHAWYERGGLAEVYREAMIAWNELACTRKAHWKNTIEHWIGRLMRRKHDRVGERSPATQ